ncbi:MAG: glycosyltransferase [Terracidiphilus sp.]
MSEVLFSVVIACYNQKDFVRESVESALSQKHPSKEVIVVDDGSSDGTVDVLRTFGDSIKLAALPVNRGVGGSRNHGASLASGKYLAFLDGDDVFMPWALEVYGHLVTSRSPVILLGQSAKCYGPVPVEPSTEPPRSVEYAEYDNFLAKDRHWVYNTSSLIVDGAAFLAAGGWSEDIFCQDIQDLLNKLGVAGRTVLVISPDTVWYRMHSTNAVRKVTPFIKGIDTLLTKSKAGIYPGGQEARIARSAWFGGLIFYWGIEAMRNGLLLEGFVLLVSSWRMILLAVVRRLGAFVSGRKPVEVLSLGQN